MFHSQVFVHLSSIRFAVPVCGFAARIFGIGSFIRIPIKRAQDRLFCRTLFHEPQSSTTDQSKTRVCCCSTLFSKKKPDGREGNTTIPAQKHSVRGTTRHGKHGSTNNDSNTNNSGDNQGEGANGIDTQNACRPQDQHAHTQTQFDTHIHTYESPTLFATLSSRFVHTA